MTTERTRSDELAVLLTRIADRDEAEQQGHLFKDELKALRDAAAVLASRHGGAPTPVCICECEPYNGQEEPNWDVKSDCPIHGREPAPAPTPPSPWTRDGDDWLFRDEHHDIWRVRRTSDRRVPLTIEIVERSHALPPTPETPGGPR